MSCLVLYCIVLSCNSLEEKNEMFDFMVQSQTLMVTLLIISAVLQFCTIALSTGCPYVIFHRIRTAPTKLNTPARAIPGLCFSLASVRECGSAPPTT